jgi:transcriptional regulator with PAS, ATPase and Fis domain
MSDGDTNKNPQAEEHEIRELLREFEENPYDPGRRTPEDVMRIFYQFNVPIVPVVSRRKTLLGIITKEEITSEMSDIDRFAHRTIDDFITGIVKKRTMDELLPYLAKEQEFVVINIFGEIQGRMTRMELLSSCEGAKKVECNDDEIAASREAQVMEWMIYLILEHIPRALYAINAEGKTIFFNSLFEDLYKNAFESGDVDHEAVERLLADPDCNEYSYRSEDSSEIVFYNRELSAFYEKIPMHSHDKLTGYLVYFGRSDASTGAVPARIEASLDERLALAERTFIVEELRRTSNDMKTAAAALGLSREALRKKMEKHGISFPEKTVLPDEQGKKGKRR